MIESLRKCVGLALIGLLATVALFGSAGVSVAQDATETPSGAVTHPAHVHKGNCADLDPTPAYPLENVGPRTDSDGNAPEPDEIKGALTASPVEMSITTIDISLDDLTKESFAINVHESDVNIQNYIACGDIGGPILDDYLLIGLNTQNDSGFSGIAKLEKDGDGTKVTIFLAQGLDGSMSMATPTS